MECKIIKNDINYNLDDLTKLLNTSYWAKDRKKETVKKTVENSLCYFVYDSNKNKLIGFARAITDYTTNYYICDVIVDEEYRGEGIGKKLVETLINAEELIHLRALLITKDAKKFYEKFGFYNKEDVMQKDKK